MMLYKFYDRMLWFIRGTIKKLPLNAALKRDWCQSIASYRDVLEIEHLVSLTPDWVFEPNGEKIIMPTYIDACPYGMISEYRDPKNIEIRVRNNFLSSDSELACYPKRVSNEVTEPNEGWEQYQTLCGKNRHGY